MDRQVTGRRRAHARARSSSRAEVIFLGSAGQLDGQKKNEADGSLEIHLGAFVDDKVHGVAATSVTCKLSDDLDSVVTGNYLVDLACERIERIRDGSLPVAAILRNDTVAPSDGRRLT